MSPSVHTFTSLLFVGSLSLVAGCGGATGPETAYVSGYVTMDGKPITAGRVMFFPTASNGKNTGKAASGQLDSSGAFELTTYRDSDGAVVGEHTVTVLKPRDGGDAAPLGVVEPQVVTVTQDGDNTFDIALKPVEPSKGRRRVDREVEENEDD